MQPYRIRARGFTLLEVMVGIAVLAIVLVLQVQITGSVLQTTRFSHQRINAAQKARNAFDALGGDLAHLVDERGMTVFFRRTGDGNTKDIELSFLTQGRGPAGGESARFIAVDYRLDKGNLVRRLSPVAWSGTSLLLDATKTVSEQEGYLVVPGVLRLEAVAVLDDGTTLPLVALSGATWCSATVDGQPVPEGFNALVLGNSTHPTSGRHVEALIIAVATLDDQTHAMLTDGGVALGQKLPAPATSESSATGHGETPVDTWNRVLAAGELKGFPRPVIATLHFAQSTYELK
jgi:prepilin-type N-terminal cleavage/methylation domain-containing protein